MTPTLLGITLVLISFATAVYWYFTKNHSYWKTRNVPFTKPSIFFGSFRDVYLNKISFPELTINLYNNYKGERFVGYFAYRTPVLLIRDVYLIERILVTDFSYFHDRHTLINFIDNQSKSIYNARGWRWKEMRYKLQIAFSSSKLKAMLEQISQCCDNILLSIKEQSRNENHYDVLPLVCKFANDVVTTCSFGVNIAADSPERKWLLDAIEKVFRVSLKKSLTHAMEQACPKIISLLGIQVIPKSVVDYFKSITKDAIKYRKQNQTERNDFLQLFLNLKEQEEKSEHLGINNYDNRGEALLEDHSKHGNGEKPPRPVKMSHERVFTEGSIAASLFSFLCFGSELTANTIGFALLELAKDPDIQQRLQKEVDTTIAKHKSWSYQAIKEMIYLDQVIQETMRLHTVGSPLTRTVTKRYSVPGSDLVLDPGQVVVIPTAAIHRDPQYHSSPLQFNPDRFIHNNFKASPIFTPFGLGPRVCLVMQFAIVVLKMCLARIVSRYSVTLNHKTRLPFGKEPGSRFPKPLGGVWLSFKLREIN